MATTPLIKLSSAEVISFFLLISKTKTIIFVGELIAQQINHQLVLK